MTDVHKAMQAVICSTVSRERASMSSTTHLRKIHIHIYIYIYVRGIMALLLLR